MAEAPTSLRRSQRKQAWTEALGGQGLRLGRHLAVGAFARVIQATRHQEGKDKEQVAVKVYCELPWPERRALAEHEFALAKTLHHPNIIRALDLIVLPEAAMPLVCMVQELASGGELLGHIGVGGILPRHLGQTVIGGVADALVYLHHEHHITHLDLKPENILLTGQSVAKVCDFDAALPIGTEVASVRGTSAIQPPECLAPAQTAAGIYTVSVDADAWALALLLFSCLTGHTAWQKPELTDPGYRHFREDHSLWPWHLFSPALLALFEGAFHEDVTQRIDVTALGVFVALHWTQEIEYVAARRSALAAADAVPDEDLELGFGFPTNLSFDLQEEEEEINQNENDWSVVVTFLEQCKWQVVCTLGDTCLTATTAHSQFATLHQFCADLSAARETLPPNFPAIDDVIGAKHYFDIVCRTPELLGYWAGTAIFHTRATSTSWKPALVFSGINTTDEPTRALESADVGSRVHVQGYGLGTLRFVGEHVHLHAPRCGVELDLPVGINNGTVRGHEYFVCAEKHGLLCVPDKVSREPDEERDNYNNYNSPATNAEEQESDEDGSSDSWGSDSSDGSEVESESESDYVGDCGQEAVLPTSTSTSLDSVTARPLQTFRFPGPPSAGQCSTTAPSMLMGLSPHCSSFSLDRLHGRLAKKGWLTKLGGGQSRLFSRQNWKRRWFVLQDTMVKYFATSEPTETQQPLGYINLGPACVVQQISVKNLVLTTPKRSYRLICDTGQDASDWMAAFLDACHRAELAATVNCAALEVDPRLRLGSEV